MTYPIENIPLVRLKKRSEFLRVASTQMKKVTPGLILQGRNHTSQEIKSKKIANVRFGFTVSKKVGNAVARNRAKRRLKAAVQFIPTNKAPSNVDFVIIGRQNTLKRPFSELVSDLEKALLKIQLPMRNT